LDWQTANPSSIVTRLERQLQRLPESLTSTRAESAAARAEANRAEARIGQPWEHSEELARLRRRQKEIDEALAETIEMPSNAAPPNEPDPPKLVEPVPGPTGADAIRQRLDAISAQPTTATGLGL